MFPQQNAPPSTSAHVEKALAETARTFASPTTAMGTALFVVAPFPS
jgi:hypothetical protein